MVQFNPRGVFSRLTGGGAFWQSRRNQILAGLVVLALLGGGGWFVFRSLLPAPEQAELSDLDSRDSRPLETDETPTTIADEPIPLGFETQAETVTIRPRSRCVEMDVARSGWDTPSGRRNLDLLNPTMLRIDTASLAAYQQGGGAVEALVALQEDARVETLFYFDLADSSVQIPLQLRALQDFARAGGGVDYLEMSTSFPDLYANQLNRFLPEIQTAFPTARLLLQRTGVEGSTLKAYEYDAAALSLAYESNVTSYEDLNLEFTLATGEVTEQAERLQRNLNLNRPVWVTNFRLAEALNAPTGPVYAPYEALQLGGTWGQALTTALGYHQLLLQEVEAICLHELSGEPQNSLYYRSENVADSTYGALVGAGNYEFTAVGQTFYTLSQAMGSASEETSQDFKINNEAKDVALWVFADEAGTRAWIVNARASQLALDMGKYGFDITGYETKSAPVEQVVLSREDVRTQVGAGLEGEDKILLNGYSLTVLDLVTKADREAEGTNQVDPEAEAVRQNQIPLNPEVNNPEPEATE